MKQESNQQQWNRKKQTQFTILTDEHVALVYSVCPGSILRIIMMAQCFAVLLILSFFGGSLGTTTSPQQQNTANLKDLCKVWNNYFVFFFFSDISGSFLGQWGKKT